jgi:phospholipid/cholesterol/gamma-HCH transport system substrate-binding protein
MVTQTDNYVEKTALIDENKAELATKIVANIELKAVLLLLLMLALISGTVAYVLYARGAFDRTQELVLTTEDSEGIVAGMDMTFSGFPIGRVRRVELAETGNVRVVIDVPSKDARWLRTSSVFTVESGLVGSTKIRAYSGVLTDPALPDGAVRAVLRGDASAEIPKLVAVVKGLTENLVRMTAEESSLNKSLANVQALTEAMNMPGGAAKTLLGEDVKLAQLSRQLGATLDRANALLAKVDGMALKTDKQIFGEKGLLSDTQATVQQVNATVGEAKTTVQQITAALGDARASLQKLDAVLVEAQGVASNTKAATNDLSALRSEVESSLRRVDQLVTEINRKWPFTRDSSLKLP